MKNNCLFCLINNKKCTGKSKKSYKNARNVTKRRIYLETLREVLEGPNKIILDDTGSGQGVVPYLPLNEINKNKVNN